MKNAMWGSYPLLYALCSIVIQLSRFMTPMEITNDVWIVDGGYPRRFIVPYPNLGDLAEAMDVIDDIKFRLYPSVRRWEKAYWGGDKSALKIQSVVRYIAGQIERSYDIS